MASPAAIRTALETRLRSIAKLNVYKRWPNQAEFPCVSVSRGAAEPEQVLGRGDLTRWRFDLYVFAGGGYEVGQDNLDPYLATSSTGGIFGAIAADRTLGGTVHSTFVRRIGEDSQFELGDDRLAIGAVIELEIWAS